MKKKRRPLPQSPGDPERVGEGEAKGGTRAGAGAGAVAVAAIVGPPPPSRLFRRSVSFTEVEIRQYSQVLGDHPCCSSGPPVSLGWDYEDPTTVELERYEVERTPHRRHRRDIRMDCCQRREILLGAVVGGGSSSSSSSSSLPSSPAVPDQGQAPAPAYTSRDLRVAERQLFRGRRVSSRKLMSHFWQHAPIPDPIGGGVPGTAAGTLTRATAGEGDCGHRHPSDDDGDCGGDGGPSDE